MFGSRINPESPSRTSEFKFSATDKTVEHSNLSFLSKLPYLYVRASSRQC